MPDYVALQSFVDDVAAKFYEEGGVYPEAPPSWRLIGLGDAIRLRQANDHVASCPRCGHLFAASGDGTAESNRDLHFDGDEDSPSICAHLWPRERREFASRLLGKRDYLGLRDDRESADRHRMQVPA